MKSIDEFSLTSARSEIALLNEQGALDNRVIDAICIEEGFANLECEVLDYKREIGGQREALAKHVRDIVSFYNTYGGYLVFGAEDRKKESVFVPIGVDATVDVHQIKDLIRTYTGRSIDIGYRLIEIEFKSRTLHIGLLHVPKRREDVSPVVFGKDGPLVDKKHLFVRDSIYFRSQDNSVPARSNEDHWFLSTDRIDSGLQNVGVQSYSKVTKLILDENLPDRNFICPEFVGRKGELLKLWQWIADEFQFSKVLAGDGGKGKSSIAYKFAEEVCTTKAYGIEKIAWLTAKAKQFRGLSDDWDVVPETHFSNYDELLRALCIQMAILPEEVENASTNLLKQLLKSALAEIPSLVIVDDIDSLPPDQQKMVLETALQVGNAHARFLLTTRKNPTYSASLCIEVAGLSKPEYSDYVSSLCETLGWRPFKAKELDILRDATDGSPLFTESLLRLVRNGMSLSDAVKHWAGRDLGKIRRTLKKAYDGGQRKAPFFDLWYYCELDSNHPMGAADVASYALDDRISDRSEWLNKRAKARGLCSATRERNLDSDGAYEDLVASREDLREAVKISNSHRKFVFSDLLNDIQEQLWQLVSRKASDISGWVTSYDVAFQAINDTTTPSIWLGRVITSVDKMRERLTFSSKISTRQYNLVDQRISQVRASLKVVMSKRHLPDEKTLQSDLDTVKRKLDRLPIYKNGDSTIEKSAQPRDDDTSANAMRFDVFLAHNHNDKPFVRAIAKRLQEKGAKPWLDENEIPPGRWFQQYIQDAIYNVRTAAIFVGPHGLGKWQSLELKSFISEAIDNNVPVIPVLLPGIKEIPPQLKFLRELNHVSFKAVDDEAAVDRLLWGIKAV